MVVVALATFFVLLLLLTRPAEISGFVLASVGVILHMSKMRFFYLNLQNRSSLVVCLLFRLCVTVIIRKWPRF